MNKPESADETRRDDGHHREAFSYREALTVIFAVKGFPHGKGFTLSRPVIPDSSVKGSNPFYSHSASADPYPLVEVHAIDAGPGCVSGVVEDVAGSVVMPVPRRRR